MKISQPPDIDLNLIPGFLFIVACATASGMYIGGVSFTEAVSTGIGYAILCVVFELLVACTIMFVWLKLYARGLNK